MARSKLDNHRRSAPGCRLHAQAAALRLGETAGDRQAEPLAAVTPTSRREGFKDGLAQPGRVMSR